MPWNTNKERRERDEERRERDKGRREDLRGKWQSVVILSAAKEPKLCDLEELVESNGPAP